MSSHKSTEIINRVGVVYKKRKKINQVIFLDGNGDGLITKYLVCSGEEDCPTVCRNSPMECPNIFQFKHADQTVSNIFCRR